jgi:transposase
MMCLAIDNPTSCEIRAVILFLHAVNMNAVEIHRELCAVYGQNVMSEGTVRQWYTMFKDGRRNVRDEGRSGRPSVVSDDHVQSDDQRNCKERRFTTS